MAAFKCSRCGSLVEVGAGETEVICPGCRGRARVPAVLAPPVEVVRPSLPPIVIHDERRFPSHGWFTRSFALTSGGCAGVVVCLFASCAGLFFIANDLTGKRVSECRDGAIAQILPRLNELKIERLEDGALVGQKDGKVYLAGNGLDSEARLHPIAAQWTVGDFGDRRVWQLESLIVDEKIVFSRELGSGKSSDL